MRTSASLALAAVLCGCHFGNSVSKVSPTHEPRGATVIVDTTRRGEAPGVRGELLGFDTARVYVRTEDGLHILNIGLPRIRWMRVAQLDVAVTRPVAPERLEPLRPFVRFPQGLSSELLERVVLAYAGTELLVVR